MSLNLEFMPNNETMTDFTTRFTENALNQSEHEELRADRKMMVEAMIVKIMKQNKVMTL